MPGFQVRVLDSVERFEGSEGNEKLQHYGRSAFLDGTYVPAHERVRQDYLYPTSYLGGELEWCVLSFTVIFPPDTTLGGAQFTYYNSTWFRYLDAPRAYLGRSKGYAQMSITSPRSRGIPPPGAETPI